MLEIEGVEHNTSIMSGNNTGENITQINSILFEIFFKTLIAPKRFYMMLY